MNSSSSASTIGQRRARRKRASLTLYGRPLRPSQTHVSPDRQEDLPVVLAARQSFMEGPSAAEAERDADALLQAIDRVQAEARRDAEVAHMLSTSELDLVVESIVREIWHDSLIKTFVPVLALRRTRDRLLSPIAE